jgi:hypothetical protein
MVKLLQKNIYSIAVLMACLVPGIGLAGLVGEPAPALNVSTWVTGSPVEIKPGTNVYVVEIWETGSKACHAAITNLNNIQTHYRDKGVIVVGVSDEPASKIQRFVDQFGTNNIQYTLAADNKRYTSLTYMNPVMQRGVPYAFVVGTNGDLLWHGSPLRGLDHIVYLVTSGAYEEDLAKKADLAAHQMTQYLALARQGSDRAGMAGQNLLAARTNDVTLLCEMAYVISAGSALPKRDFALAGQALDQAERIAPTNSVPVTVARAIWLFESGKQDDGLARARLALSFAQTPLEKTNIQICINTMQRRQAAGPASQNNSKADAPALPNPSSSSNPN